MILNLWLISLIVALIFRSGFPFEIDDMIARSKALRFHHLPSKPFLCALCCCFWVEVIYLLIAGQMSLFGLFMALVFAVLEDIYPNVIAVVETALNSLLAALINLFNIKK